VLEADVEVDRRDFTVRACLTVAPGERLALFGPSGAGKTTLLEVIAGLVAPRRARITLGGRVLTSTGAPAIQLPPWQRRVGLLRQDPGLFPHLSVRDNLLYSRSGAAAEAELTAMAEVLGIAGLVSAMPARLSGGQGHRVALGRLLLSHCDALLLDEPYTGLDASLRRTLTDLVVSLVAQRGIPAILVAHELAEAQAFADRLAVLDSGQVLQTGAPADVVLRPASRRVAELVGYGGFVPLPSAEPQDGPVPGAEPAATDSEPGRDQDGEPPAQSVAGSVAGQDPGQFVGQVAGIHPDRVVSGSHADRGVVLAGVVIGCRPAGALWELTVLTSGATLMARLPDAAPAGQRVVLTAVDPPRFGQDGAAVPRGQAEQASRAVAGRDGSAGRDGAGRDGAGRDGAGRDGMAGPDRAGRAGVQR
jgi:ABC-type Fe3+/spermidine/putrescine transport system ATPase subunit